MAFPSPNPMIVRCQKCGWSHKQESDVIETFGSCPKCGNEELELAFAKGNPFESSVNGQSSSASLLDKVKKVFKL